MGALQQGGTAARNQFPEGAVHCQWQTAVTAVHPQQLEIVDGFRWGQVDTHSRPSVQHTYAALQEATAGHGYSRWVLVGEG
jgi:hypothetical protein